MMKKVCICGCVIIVLLHIPKFKQMLRERTHQALQGLLIVDEPNRTGSLLSALLLVVRVLISSLFLFVGYGEIWRHWRRAHHIGEHIDYAEGDGHNQMWLKLIQFGISIPFVLGFRLTLASAALCFALLTESLVYWAFWATRQELGLQYAVHAREHFFINMAVAGGLYLLNQFGPGRFSIDELLAKKQS
eukprot:TRINITY_DN746_c0_g1_i2.p2 TRINITY_DN746_c0_g1~~TRINITY_DN746_c0_g1_i2.p2  ORF type:complete len:189 (-),score=47.57 TRINITY_DN746_c0_g1_i2:68-634(-)